VGAVQTVTRAAALGIAVLAMASGALLLAGCGGASLSVASPQALSHTISSTNDGTEQSERVELQVKFDRAVSVGVDALDDLVVTVDGAKLSKKMAVCSVAQTDVETLVLTIAAAPGVTGSTGDNYFALKNGELSVAAADRSGALRRVTSADGGTAAKWTAIKCRIPSGLEISVMSSAAGTAAAGRAATAAFQVAKTPAVRVVSWLQMESGGKQVFVHNHEFLKYDVQSYAQHLAESLNALFSGEFTFTANGDAVTVTAAKVIDGQVIAPAVCVGDL
jgi:hypothetical protein